jgi:hypothetical protein
MKMNFSTYFEKTLQINIDGVMLKFRYPTIADNIAIQSRLTLLTRGQYAALAASFVEEQRETAQLAYMSSVLGVLVSFTDKNMRERSWESLSDEEESVVFMTKVYDEFLKWRDSFRRAGTEKDRPASESASEQSNSSTGVPEEVQPTAG